MIKLSVYRLIDSLPFDTVMYTIKFDTLLSWIGKDCLSEWALNIPFTKQIADNDDEQEYGFVGTLAG